MKKYKDKRVLILSPIMHSEPKFWKSVVNMVAKSWKDGLEVHEIGITERVVVDWARNNLGRAALEKKAEYGGGYYTHFLWLDSDHVFNPDLLTRLMGHDVDMVSALYFGRTSPHLPVVYVKGDDKEDEYKHFPLIQVPNCLFECDAVGFGALLMKREVLEKVPEPWFTIDWKSGEDVAFCVKAKKHGVKIFCDGQYKLGHIGDPQIVTLATYEQYMSENKDKYADRVKINLG